jgi:hypothetical protein
MGETKGAYRVLVEKPDGRSPLERPRRRWEDSIKINLREVRWRKWNGSILFRTGTGCGLL